MIPNIRELETNATDNNTNPIMDSRAVTVHPGPTKVITKIIMMKL
jgi:hypothetical protein